MASENKIPISFFEWEQLFLSDQAQEPEIVIESIEEAVEVPEEEPEEEVPVKNEALEKIRNLCRVCSSNGLISIASMLTPKMFRMFKPPSGDMRPWQLPIARILEEVSGESIQIDDNLPQFICQHCLGYLQHAYTMRLKIKETTASLRMSLMVADNESFNLDQKIDIKRVTKREVDQINEQHHEEGHFFEAFRGTNIEISSGSQNRTVERAVEQKCLGCFARLLSVQALNNHTQNCENIALNNFFTDFKQLYSQQMAKELTNVEFVLLAFKLIFDTTKKLQKIAKAKGINVNAVTSQLPPKSELRESIDTRTNPFRRNYNQKSPDNGYASGGSQNYSQRF